MEFNSILILSDSKYLQEENKYFKTKINAITIGTVRIERLRDGKQNKFKGKQGVDIMKNNRH